ncbi:MAG: hypothetical protein WCG35_04320 [Betaproteobacteria bacterium]
MSLPDKHLQQALQHAPDRELAPNEITRKAVLDYAAIALLQRKSRWLQRCQHILTLEYWHIPRWQLAGMGSTIAILLVVAVFWDEHVAELRTGKFNGEPIQVASAPTESLQQNADGLAGRAKDEKTQPVSKPMRVENPTNSRIIAANESSDNSSVQNKAALNTKSTELGLERNETQQTTAPVIITADKFVVASAPEAVVDQNVGSSIDASVGLKQRLPSIGVDALAPTDKAVAVNNIGERSDRLGNAEVDKDISAKKLALTSENRSEAKVKIKKDVSSSVGTIVNSNMAQNNAMKSGVALANKDIQAGILRILTHGKPTVTSVPLIDAVTGYRIQIIEGSDVSTLLPDEVEAYNQVMQDYYARSSRLN